MILKRNVRLLLEKLNKKLLRSLEVHIHMLLAIPPEISVSSFIGYLKGKNSLILYKQSAILNLNITVVSFGVAGVYVDTVGKNSTKIQDCIKK